MIKNGQSTSSVRLDTPLTRLYLFPQPQGRLIQKRQKGTNFAARSKSDKEEKRCATSLMVISTQMGTTFHTTITFPIQTKASERSFLANPTVLTKHSKTTNCPITTNSTKFRSRKSITIGSFPSPRN